MAIDVDDILIFSAGKKAIDVIKEVLKAKFYMSDLGSIKFYLQIALILDRTD